MLIEALFLSLSLLVFVSGRDENRYHSAETDWEIDEPNGVKGAGWAPWIQNYRDVDWGTRLRTLGSRAADTFRQGKQRAQTFYLDNQDAIHGTLAKGKQVAHRSLRELTNWGAWGHEQGKAMYKEGPDQYMQTRYPSTHKVMKQLGTAGKVAFHQSKPLVRTVAEKGSALTQEMLRRAAPIVRSVTKTVLNRSGDYLGRAFKAGDQAYEQRRDDKVRIEKPQKREGNANSERLDRNRINQAILNQKALKGVEIARRKGKVTSPIMKPPGQRRDEIKFGKFASRIRERSSRPQSMPRKNAQSKRTQILR